MTSRPVNISAAATVSFDWSHSNQYWTSYNDQMTLRVRKETSGSWDTLVYLNGQTFNAAGSGISTPGTFENEFIYLDTSYIGHNVIFEFLAFPAGVPMSSLTTSWWTSSQPVQIPY